jgi:regulator of protease activity HflC (stomatin/prohibitin superfamily)
MVQEREIRPSEGYFPLFVWLTALLASPVGLGFSIRLGSPALAAASALLFVTAFIAIFGLIVINPNESKVLVLFGSYKGTVKEPGFFYVNPFYTKRKLSLRVRNFETGVESTPETKNEHGIVTSPARHTRRPSKVNDRDGNPIEIAAVVVWKVVDSAAALFQVDDYEGFTQMQCESALRNLATRYHYDSDDETVHSLRGNTDEVAAQLKVEVQERVTKAGVEIIDARISYLAYAPEIAAAMLQRQQATAVIAARQKIVDGAVGMVEMALARLTADKLVELDPERKSAMVSNLLVVLCGDRAPHPVLNVSSIY